jgi:CubicO group peptidase (beta-lactamase class C family)
MKYVPVLCLILFTFTAGITRGQGKVIRRIDGSTISTTALDREVNRLMDAARVTGLALAIINRDEVVYLKTYGHKNKEADATLDPGTVFYGASFSKAVFAFLVMQLVEEGRLDLDKPVYGYLPKPLPEYENYADLATDARWKMITARMLLSHTAGFPNWRWLSPRENKKLEIFYTPGTRYAYSGEGLTLLQMVVEEITGESLETLARKRVFEPFGMHRTSYLWQPRFEDNYALGYDEAGKAATEEEKDQGQRGRLPGNHPGGLRGLYPRGHAGKRTQKADPGPDAHAAD